MAFSFALYSILSYVSPPSIMIFSSSSFTDLLSSSYVPFATMHFTNNFNRFAAAVSLFNMAASVSNGRRSTSFSAIQSLYYLYIGDGNPNLVSSNGKFDVNVDGYYCWCRRRSCEGEGSNKFPEVLVTNGLVRECQLDAAQSGALGEYGHIWEIFAYMFEFLSGWISCAHDIFDQTDILVPESLLIMVEYKRR